MKTSEILDMIVDIKADILIDRSFNLIDKIITRRKIHKLEKEVDKHKKAIKFVGKSMINEDESIEEKDRMTKDEKEEIEEIFLLKDEKKQKKKGIIRRMRKAIKVIKGK